jgi:hypothetical protein
MVKSKNLDIGFAEVSKFTEIKGDLGNLVESIYKSKSTKDNSNVLRCD